MPPDLERALMYALMWAVVAFVAWLTFGQFVVGWLQTRPGAG